MEKETESILEWFRKGCKDELHGSSSVCSDSEIENQAYMLGAKLAGEGKVKKSDELTDKNVYWLIVNYDFEKYLIKQNIKVDKLIEKHTEKELCRKFGLSDSDAMEEHANITKEYACGFSEWLKVYYSPSIFSDKWISKQDLFNNNIEYITNSELFDIYLTTLK